MGLGAGAIAARAVKPTSPVSAETAAPVSAETVGPTSTLGGVSSWLSADPQMAAAYEKEAKGGAEVNRPETAIQQVERFGKAIVSPAQAAYGSAMSAFTAGGDIAFAYHFTGGASGSGVGPYGATAGIHVGKVYVMQNGKPTLLTNDLYKNLPTGTPVYDSTGQLLSETLVNPSEISNWDQVKIPSGPSFSPIEWAGIPEAIKSAIFGYKNIYGNVVNGEFVATGEGPIGSKAGTWPGTTWRDYIEPYLERYKAAPMSVKIARVTGGLSAGIATPMENVASWNARISNAFLTVDKNGLPHPAGGAPAGFLVDQYGNATPQPEDLGYNLGIGEAIY